MKGLKIDKNMSIWYLFVIGLLIALIGRIIMRKLYPKKEGFTTHDKYILKEGDKVFDNFYVNYYDKLVYSREKNNFEYGKIKELTDLTQESRVLDIGSGTGHHLNLFAKNNIPGIGLDNSSAMIEYAEKVYPDLTFQHGNAENYQYPNGSFTHILCLYFTIYYMKNKDLMFKNCFNWLVPGGYIVLHLVNKNMFNPVLPSSNKIRNVNTQKYENGRITKSILKLDQYNYTSHFKLEGNENMNESIFQEKFTDNSGKVRQNNHIFYMETQKDILFKAKDAGFILLAKVDMASIDYNHQYLYILQKPN